MTAPNGSIVFNNSTGSDTQASGLGPANAVYGTGASTTGASAVVTGIDTTGVTAGDLLWVESSSGRQFSIIASVDSSTQVTCDDNFDNTESGRTWAIGGKRSGLSGTTQIWADVPSSDMWELELEYTGTNYTISSTIYFSQKVSVTGTGGRPIIEMTADSTAMFRANLRILYSKLKNLKFINTASVKSVCILCYDPGPNVELIDCVFGEPNNSFTTHISKAGLTSVSILGKNTIFTNSTSHAISHGGALHLTFDKCIIKNSGGNGWNMGHNNMSLNFKDCQIINNSGYGIYWHYIYAGTSFNMTNCIVSGNGSDGIYFTGVSETIMRGCIIANNGGYGLRANTANTRDLDYMTYNAFYANSSGNLSNITLDSTNINLTADPFVNAANGDFNINTSNGGGAALRSTSYDLGG